MRAGVLLTVECWLGERGPVRTPAPLCCSSLVMGSWERGVLSLGPAEPSRGHRTPLPSLDS